MRHASNPSRRVDSSDSMNSFNILSEALMVSILKTKRLLCSLWVYGFNRQINIWHKYDMIACRGLIVEGRVKLNHSHDPGSIELQTQDVRSRCSKLANEEVLGIEAFAMKNMENQSLHCALQLCIRRVSFD